MDLERPRRMAEAVARLHPHSRGLAADPVRRLSTRWLRRTGRVASHDLPNTFLELAILGRVRVLRERSCIRASPPQVLERLGKRYVGAQRREPPEEESLVAMRAQVLCQRRRTPDLHRPSLRVTRDILEPAVDREHGERGVSPQRETPG